MTFLDDIWLVFLQKELIYYVKLGVRLKILVKESNPKMQVACNNWV